jgi:hydroxymethylpyrimidine pyrophosphatase-like HAD family hydrolase
MEAPVLLKRGIVFGMSNGSLIEIPEWDKVLRGKNMFEEILNDSIEEVKELPDKDIPYFLEKGIAQNLISDVMRNESRSTWANT